MLGRAPPPPPPLERYTIPAPMRGFRAPGVRHGGGSAPPAGSLNADERARRDGVAGTALLAVSAAVAFEGGR